MTAALLAAHHECKALHDNTSDFGLERKESNLSRSILNKHVHILFHPGRTFKCEQILNTFRNTSFFLKVMDFVSEVAICRTPSEKQSVVYGSGGVEPLPAILKPLTVYNQTVNIKIKRFRI